MLGKLSKAKLPKEARELIAAVRRHLAQIDSAMEAAESPTRGGYIAASCNQLEFSVDSFEHYGIKGYPAKKNRGAK